MTTRSGLYGGNSMLYGVNAVQFKLDLTEPIGRERMSDLKMSGNDIRDKSGRKLGVLSGDTLRDASGRTLLKIQRDDIRDSSGKKLASVSGNDIHDGSGKKIGAISDIREKIDGGLGGVSLAAVWLAFLR